MYKRAKMLVDKYRPEMTVIEQPWYGTNANTTIALGEIRGALFVAALSRGGPVMNGESKRAKLYVTGDGHAKKRTMRLYAERQLRLEGQLDDNAADALGLALIAANEIGQNFSMRKAKILK